MNGDAGPQRAHAIEHDGDQLFRERIDSRMEAWLGQVIVEFVDKVVQLRSRTNRRSLRVLGHRGPPKHEHETTAPRVCKRKQNRVKTLRVA
jgi:hypothetical protein